MFKILNLGGYHYEKKIKKHFFKNQKTKIILHLTLSV